MNVEMHRNDPCFKPFAIGLFFLSGKYFVLFNEDERVHLAGGPPVEAQCAA
jgi:hypothetical protein